MIICSHYVFFYTLNFFLEFVGSTINQIYGNKKYRNYNFLFCLANSDNGHNHLLQLCTFLKSLIKSMETKSTYRIVSVYLKFPQQCAKSKTGSSEAAAFDKWLLGKHFFHFKMVPTSFFPYSANFT